VTGSEHGDEGKYFSLPSGKLFNIAKPREMENISRGPPTFGNLVTILTERSMQDNTVVRLQSTKVQTPLSTLY
jgi:hypothetical protein